MSTFTPSIEPTLEPTQPTMLAMKEHNTASDYVTVTMVILGILLCSISIILIYCWSKKRKLEECFEEKKISAGRRRQHTQIISNPLVIVIVIGCYDDEMRHDSSIGYLMDLDAAKRDYVNMKKLCKIYNYHLYPVHLQIEWSQSDIMDLLEQAAICAANGDYDSILFVCSGHGMSHNIITSDYQFINKDAIHRYFSIIYPSLREIPRIFIYDVCDGGGGRDEFSYSHSDDDEDEDEDEKWMRIQTGFGMDDYNFISLHGVNDGITENKDPWTAANNQHTLHGANINVGFAMDGIAENKEPWSRNKHGADYKLITLYGANVRFQAKQNSILGIHDGSHLVYSFTKKMLENAEREHHEGMDCIGDIMDQIQEELHKMGKQKIVNTYNNNTRYLKFAINKNELKEEEMIESVDHSATEIEFFASPRSSIRRMLGKKTSIINMLSKKDNVEYAAIHPTKHMEEIKQMEEVIEMTMRGNNDGTGSVVMDKNISKPLCKFSSKDICKIIREWIENDIHYKRGLENMKQIFLKHILTGKLLINLPENIARRGLQDDLLKFMTEDTIDIIFHHFNKWKEKDSSAVELKDASEIAEILYNYPLNNLLQKIIDTQINGENILNNLVKKEMIKAETGWNNDEIYQIEATLFKYKTFNKEEFVFNMNNIVLTYKDGDNQQLPQMVINRIKETIIGFDVVQLHFDIKNNKNIIDFSDIIVNLVDDLIVIYEENKDEHVDVDDNNNDDQDAYFEGDFVKGIYEKIAECFILDTVNLKDCKGSICRAYDWICCNCGCNNFSTLIGSKVNIDLSRCSLCGIQQKDAIILKLRNHDTFIMARNVDNDIIEMIETVITTNKIDLFCLNKNNKGILYH